MNTNFNHTIIDQINRWVQSAETMSMATAKLKEEFDHVFTGDESVMPPSPIKLLPTISLVGKRLTCNGTIIPVSRKPLAIELFRVFMLNPDHAFSREELVDLIYHNVAATERTSRLTAALNQNIIKLISRTRMIADHAVNRGGNKWIDWFCYNAESRQWTFYRLTNPYLRKKQEILASLTGTHQNQCMTNS